MDSKLTDEQIAQLAVKLAENWQALIPKFALPQEKVPLMIFGTCHSLLNIFLSYHCCIGHLFLTIILIN